MRHGANANSDPARLARHKIHQYRERAEECRALASNMREPETKRQLHNIADDYMGMITILERVFPPQAVKPPLSPQPAAVPTGK